MFLVANGLVRIVGIAVGEEVVDDHADYWEEEHNEGPDDLVGDRAVRLENLDCRADMSALGSEQGVLPASSRTGADG